MDTSKLMTALRRKYATPQDVLRALGIDAAVLESETRPPGAGLSPSSKRALRRTLGLDAAMSEGEVDRPMLNGEAWRKIEEFLKGKLSAADLAELTSMMTVALPDHREAKDTTPGNAISGERSSPGAMDSRFLSDFEKDGQLLEKRYPGISAIRASWN
jgi:hypothetical protein